MNHEPLFPTKNLQIVFLSIFVSSFYFYSALSSSLTFISHLLTPPPPLTFLFFSCSLHSHLSWHSSKACTLIGLWRAQSGHIQRETDFVQKKKKENQCIPYWGGENSYGSSDLSRAILLWPQHDHKPIWATDWTQLTYTDWIIRVCFIPPCTESSFGRRRRADGRHLAAMFKVLPSVTTSWSCTDKARLQMCNYCSAVIVQVRLRRRGNGDGKVKRR